MRHIGTANLIPFNKRTPEEIRAIGSKGGKACAEKKRQRKKLREWAEIFGEQEVVNSNGDKMLRDAVVILQLYNAAIRGDIKAARFIADILGETTQAKLLDDALRPIENNITLKID